MVLLNTWDWTNSLKMVKLPLMMEQKNCNDSYFLFLNAMIRGITFQESEDTHERREYTAKYRMWNANYAAIHNYYG